MSTELIVSLFLTSLIHGVLLFGTLPFISCDKQPLFSVQEELYSMEVAFIPLKEAKPSVAKDAAWEKITPEIQVEEPAMVVPSPKEMLEDHVRPDTSLPVLPSGARVINEAVGINNKPPVYPLLAHECGYEGEVVLLIDIDTRGAVNGIAVKKSSGYAILDNSAIKAARLWRFIPAYRADEPVAAQKEIAVAFILEE